MRTGTKIAAYMFALGTLLATAGLTRTAHAQEKAPMKQLSKQQKIALALSAGPSNIAKNATVAEPDGHGGLTVLRPGTNDFTCMPGDPRAIGKPGGVLGPGRNAVE